MTRERRNPRPLDSASLDRLALRYVERFATTRGRLAAYLKRKIRERGWDGPLVDPETVAERFAALGYIDDRAFAEARVRSMTRRGLGSRRIAATFRADGIDGEDAAELEPQIAAGAIDAALALARRRRIGPFGVQQADRAARERHLAQMIRGGHDIGLSRRIVSMAPGADIDVFHNDE
jgi:regulatory protein